MEIYKKPNQTIRLLPGYFRWIGLVVMIVFPFLFLVIIKYANPGFYRNQSEALELIFTNFFILGLFLMALTKDKVEDELTMLLRLKAMGFAFGTAILYVIMNPIFNLIWGEAIKELKAQVVILSMLLMYIILFFILKRKR